MEKQKVPQSVIDILSRAIIGSGMDEHYLTLEKTLEDKISELTIELNGYKERRIEREVMEAEIKEWIENIK